MNQKKIGQFIKERRKEKKLTQEELAEKLRVSNRTISKWENGNSIPDYSIINDLCTALDVSINELLSGEKINKDDYQRKFEENFLKTMKYNNRKMNHSTIKVAIAFIVVLVLCLYFGYKYVLMQNLHIEDYKMIRQMAEGAPTYIQENVENDVEANNKVTYNDYYDVEFYLDPQYKITYDANEGAKVATDTYVKKEKDDIVGTYQLEAYNGPTHYDDISYADIPYETSLRLQKKFGIYNIVDYYEYFLNMKPVNYLSTLDQIRMYASASGAFVYDYYPEVETHGIRGNLYGLYTLTRYDDLDDDEDDDEKTSFWTTVYLYNLERNSRLTATISLSNVTYNEFIEEVNNFIRSVKFQEGR